MKKMKRFLFNQSQNQFKEFLNIFPTLESLMTALTWERHWDSYFARQKWKLFVKFVNKVSVQLMENATWAPDDRTRQCRTEEIVWAKSATL